MCRKFRADFINLFRQVAKEARSTIAVGIICELDDIGEGSWIRLFGECSNRCEAFISEVVAQAVPDYEGKWGIIVIVFRLDRVLREDGGVDEGRGGEEGE